MNVRLSIGVAAVVVAALGAGVGWYRVADTYVVSAQVSRMIATGFGALTTLALVAVLAAGFSSRREAARRGAARAEAVALATAAVASLLQSRTSGGSR
jgi:hypothetical protein